MPLIFIRDIWKYTTYNKAFFLFILFLFFILTMIRLLFEENHTYLTYLEVIAFVITTGYGMIITKDIINHGKRLPKIVIKDVFILGIKSSVVSYIYFIVQNTILMHISSPLDFPEFELEDMLMNLQDTVQLLYSHSPVDTIIFIILSLIALYITVFFMEIGLAKLADTGSILDALNLYSIKKTIDVIGWIEYTKHYTLIIISLSFYSLLLNIIIPNVYLNTAYEIFLLLLIFVTQYVGIGAVYRIFKDKQSNN